MTNPTITMLHLTPVSLPTIKSAAGQIRASDVFLSKRYNAKRMYLRPNRVEMPVMQYSDLPVSIKLTTERAIVKLQNKVQSYGDDRYNDGKMHMLRHFLLSTLMILIGVALAFYLSGLRHL
jgi:hypothetical protein